VFKGTPCCTRREAKWCRQSWKRKLVTFASRHRLAHALSILARAARRLWPETRSLQHRQAAG
jgi:hypothetical protein